MRGIRARREQTGFATRIACSCQFLAQTTYLYTSVKQSPKALLERESERVKGVELDTDHPAAAPANNPWHRPYFLQQAH